MQPDRAWADLYPLCGYSPPTMPGPTFFNAKCACNVDINCLKMRLRLTLRPHVSTSPIRYLWSRTYCGDRPAVELTVTHLQLVFPHLIWYKKYPRLHQLELDTILPQPTPTYLLLRACRRPSLSSSVTNRPLERTVKSPSPVKIQNSMKLECSRYVSLCKKSLWSEWLSLRPI